MCVYNEVKFFLGKIGVKIQIHRPTKLSKQIGISLIITDCFLIHTYRRFLSASMIFGIAFFNCVFIKETTGE